MVNPQLQDNEVLLCSRVVIIQSKPTGLFVTNNKLCSLNYNSYSQLYRHQLQAENEYFFGTISFTVEKDNAHFLRRNYFKDIMSGWVPGCYTGSKAV